MARQLNKNSNDLKYEPGEKVWMHNHNRKNLEPVHSHLVKIIEKARGAAYRV